MKAKVARYAAFFPRQPGIPARVQQHHVDRPHQQRQQDLGIQEVHGPEMLLRDHRPGDQPEGHERKAQQQRLVADVVNHFQRRQLRQIARQVLGLQAALLQQVQNAGAEAEEQRGVAGEDQRDVGENPAAAHQLGVEQRRPLRDRGGKGQQEHQRKHENSRRERPVARVHEQEKRQDHEGQQRFRFVDRHQRQRQVAGDHGALRQRDKMEHHAQAERREHDLRQEIAGTAHRRRRPQQADDVETDRDF